METIKAKERTVKKHAVQKAWMEEEKSGSETGAHSFKRESGGASRKAGSVGRGEESQKET